MYIDGESGIIYVVPADDTNFNSKSLNDYS